MYKGGGVVVLYAMGQACNESSPVVLLSDSFQATSLTKQKVTVSRHCVIFVPSFRPSVHLTDLQS